MIVNSHHVEFGYELLSVLPYAYHLNCSGKLDGSISGVDTKCLYFFSPDHTEINDKQRSFGNIHIAKHYGVPNTIIHRPDLDWDVWNPPPLKEHYAPMAISFHKPTVCICNRYTREWDGEPVNFFDLDILKKMFRMLQDKYQIVYVSVRGKDEYFDHSPEIDSGDYEMIKKEFPLTVKIIHDISREQKLSFNETQLRVYAGCEKYITMNGGFGILASYFGGENIIYSKHCQELNPKINSFNKWYHRLGGSFINHVNSYNDLLEAIDTLYVKNKTGKVYFLFNTANKLKTKEKALSLLSENKFNRIVVFSQCFGVTKFLEGIKCICDDSYLHKNHLANIDQEIIAKYTQGKDYDMYDIASSTIKRKIDITSAKNEKHYIKNFYIAPNHYEEYNDFIPSEINYTKINSNLAVIYTACSQNYRYTRDDIVCFNPVKSDNEVMDAKIYKILGHKYFKDAKYLIWTDANIFPQLSPQELIDKYLGDADIAIFKHPWRDCLYEEINIVRETKRLQIKPLLNGLARQQRDYESDKYPLHNGLWECNFFIRKNDKKVNALFEKWWEHITKYQQRDQVSFPYVLWKYGKDIKINTITTGDIRNNTDFIYLNHY